MRCQVTAGVTDLLSRGVAANWLLTPAETPTWDLEAQSHLSELRRLLAVWPQPLANSGGAEMTSSNGVNC